METIRIGTRGSALARAQTAWVKRKLEEESPELEVKTIVIKTTGDRFPDTPAVAIGGKGIFVKEIEEALLRDEIDLAIHSLKDLPAETPAGLVIATVPQREDARDVLVSLNYSSLTDLPSGARIGTGSPRRKAQILHHRKDLLVQPIRGNIDTRLKKLDRGDVDALILAAAGLKRMGLDQRICEYLAPEICLSAVAQGALGLEIRDGDAIKDEIAFLHHLPTALEIRAERAFLEHMGGGCLIPVGARAWLDEGKIRMMGVVADIEGTKLLRAEVSGDATGPDKLGKELAENLLGRGGEEIVASKQRQSLQEGP
jgi:hydroxymethylbilane synthase